MKLLPTLGLFAAFLATPAFAALNIGDQAPDFTTQASLGGKVFTFSLADALKKGPVAVSITSRRSSLNTSSPTSRSIRLSIMNSG